MAKKDISKILTTGSTRQKLLLVAEDRARGSFSFQFDELKGRKPQLSEKEFTAISESFKTPSEIKLWNKNLHYGTVVNTSISNLQGAMLEVGVQKSNLRGYILVWNAIQEAELIINSILHETKDPTERKRIAEMGAIGPKFLFTNTEVDPEGYIELQTDRRKAYRKNGKAIGIDEEPEITNVNSLEAVIQNVKRQATASIVKFITWRKALLDYMEEKNFNVPTYKDIIQALTETVYTPVIGWNKYQTDEPTFSRIFTERVDKLKGKYSVTPNIEALDIDQDLYNQITEMYYKDE